MNTVKPIRNETDYDAALAEIEALMDAEQETSAGDRLDVLVTLVEAYETKHWRIEAKEETCAAHSANIRTTIPPSSVKNAARD